MTSLAVTTLLLGVIAGTAAQPAPALKVLFLPQGSQAALAVGASPVVDESGAVRGQRVELALFSQGEIWKQELSTEAPKAVLSTRALTVERSGEDLVVTLPQIGPWQPASLPEGARARAAGADLPKVASERSARLVLLGANRGASAQRDVDARAPIPSGWSSYAATLVGTAQVYEGRALISQAASPPGDVWVLRASSQQETAALALLPTLGGPVGFVVDQMGICGRTTPSAAVVAAPGLGGPQRLFVDEQAACFQSGALAARLTTKPAGEGELIGLLWRGSAPLGQRAAQ